MANQANEIQKDNCAKIKGETEADIQTFKDFEKKIAAEKENSKQKIISLTELRNYYVKRIEANNKYLVEHKQEPVPFTPPPKKGRKVQSAAPEVSPQ